MKVSITLNNIIKRFIYIIGFFSTFRNSLIYIVGNRDSLMFALDYLYLGFLLVTLFFIMYLRNAGEYVRNSSTKYILFLLVWVLIKSIAVSLGTLQNSISRILVTSLLTTLVIVLGVKDSRQFYNTVWSAGIGFFITAFLPLLLHPELIGTRFEVYNGVAYSGGFWNYPLVSFVSVAWILMASTYMDCSKPRHRIIAFIIFLIGWFASFAGLSRIFLVITIVSVLAFVFSSNGYKFFVRFIAIFFIGLVLLQLIDSEIISRLFLRLNPLLTGEVSEEARIGIWRGFLQNMEKYVLVGSTTDYRTLGGIGWYGGTHSAFLNWFVQYGMLGLIGYLYLLWGLLKSIISFKSSNSSIFSFLMAWFVGYLALVSVNETGFYEPSFYMAFGLILIWPNINNSFKKNT